MGAAFVLISFIVPLLICTALAALILPAIWRTVTPPRKGVKVPSCEKCRYPVAGNTALVCPECGTDLRLTGIITRPMEMRRRGHLFGALMAWTFLVLFVGYIAFALIWAAPISTAATGGSTVTTVANTLSPASSAYRSIEVAQDYGVTGAPINMSLVLNDGSERKLSVNYSVGTAQLTDAAGLESTVAVDEQMISKWFAVAGLPTDDPVVAVEMKDVLRVVDYAGASGWNLTGLRLSKLTVSPPRYSTPPTAATPSGSSSLSAVTIPAIIGGICLIWVLGIVAIVFRRRKLMREAKAADAHTPTPTPIGPVSTI